MLLRELDHAARHGQVGVGAVEVEFADAGVAVLCSRSSRYAITVSSRTHVPTSPRVRYGRSSGIDRSGAAW